MAAIDPGMTSRRGFLYGTGGLALFAAGNIHSTSPLLAQPGTIDPILYLDPELRQAARAMLAGGGLKLDTADLEAMRAEAAATAEPLLSDVSVEQRSVAGMANMPDVTVYLVNADGTPNRPGILHTHGGGHVLGAARNELRYLQEMARDLDCLLVTVEYRLAPETRFDGSIEDNYAALRWMHGAAGEIGLDPSRIAVMGESAGGTHAALLALVARDRGEVPIAFQSLVYPMLDDRTGSTRRVPPWIGKVLWDENANRFGWRTFLGAEPGGVTVPAEAVPARYEDLSGLPPAWIGTGGADLFFEEDVEYARRLTNAGVATELLVIPRAFHAFDRIVPQASLSRRFTHAKMDALRRAFAVPAPN